MPNIEIMYLLGAVMCEKLLPSLRWLYFEGTDRSTLVNHLAHQASGNQAVSLAVLGRGVCICLGIMERMCELVEEPVYQTDPDEIVPLIHACRTLGTQEVIRFYESWFTRVRLVTQRRSEVLGKFATKTLHSDSPNTMRLFITVATTQ